jgi:hypothetical protein
MADIFVSYSKADKLFVAPIVSFLQSEGWTVWWDQRIDAGESWDEVIEREIHAAKCIVVVWTSRSIESRWVRTEANEGLTRNCLVPVALEKTEQPLAFRLIQRIDLTRWAEKFTDPSARELANAVRRVVSGEKSTEVLPSLVGKPTALRALRELFAFLSWAMLILGLGMLAWSAHVLQTKTITSTRDQNGIWPMLFLWLGPGLAVITSRTRSPWFHFWFAISVGGFGYWLSKLL